MTSNRFAVIIPVGPQRIDAWRAVQLIKSVVRWEPAVAWCVIVDDGLESRGISERPLFPSTCSAVTIMNPRQGRGIGWSGGLVTGMLAALSWIHRYTDAEFALKLDTDALVIGPVAEKIFAYLRRTPDAGLIGTRGASCNPEVPDGLDVRSESHLVRLHRILPRAPREGDAEESEWLDVQGFLHVPIRKLRAFDRIRPIIEAAIRNGYTTSEYCQGGAYAIARAAIDRMAAAGCFEHAGLWPELPFCEDMTMALYVRAVGMHIHDYSRPGEPFGLQYRGLPYPLETIAAHDYRVIHSVRNDPRYTEQAIRAFFARSLAHRAGAGSR